MRVADGTFEYALGALKDGERVYRTGWNGKEMWLVLIHPGNALYTKTGTGYPMMPCIGIKAADDGNMYPGWVPSQADMLATDWAVL